MFSVDWSVFNEPALLDDNSWLIYILNGLGSAVSEVVSENCPIPVKRIGVKDRFGEVGSIDYLKGIFGMTVEDIVAAAKETLARKAK